MIPAMGRIFPLSASIAVITALLSVAFVCATFSENAAAAPSGTRTLVPPKKNTPRSEQDAPPPVESLVPGTALPDRQREFLTILANAQQRYRSARTATAKLNVRLGLQVSIANYMEVSQEASEWVGVVRGTRTTTEGDLFLSVSVGPTISLSTWTNHLYDQGDLTLVRRGSQMFGVVKELKAGEPIIFSATLLVYDISDDDAVITRPSLIARFKSVRTVATP